MNKQLLISGTVALVVSVIVAAFFFRPPDITVTPEVTIAPEARPIGAIPGTSVNSNVFTVGGVTKGYANSAFSIASSTMCSIQNPVGATSTLDAWGVVMERNGGGAFTFDIATSTLNVNAGASVLSTSGASTSPSLSARVRVPNNVASGTPYMGFQRRGASTSPLTTTGLINGSDGSATLITDKEYGVVTNFLLGPTDYVNYLVATSAGNTGLWASSTQPRGNCILEVTGVTF